MFGDNPGGTRRRVGKWNRAGKKANQECLGEGHLHVGKWATGVKSPRDSLRGVCNISDLWRWRSDSWGFYPATLTPTVEGCSWDVNSPVLSTCPVWRPKKSLWPQEDKVLTKRTEMLKKGHHQQIRSPVSRGLQNRLGIWTDNIVFKFSMYITFAIGKILLKN